MTVRWSCTWDALFHRKIFASSCQLIRTAHLKAAYDWFTNKRPIIAKDTTISDLPPTPSSPLSMLTSSSMAATVSGGRCQLRYPEPDAITILSDPGVCNFGTAAARCPISQMCKFGQRKYPKPSWTISYPFPAIILRVVVYFKSASSHSRKLLNS
jgi:hypothetical protein